MSSRGAFGPIVANASRAAATRSSTLRRASARRARTPGREAVRLSIGSGFMGDLINGDSPRIVTSDKPEGSPGYLTILAPRTTPVTRSRPSAVRRLKESSQLMSSAFPDSASTRDDRWLALAVLCAGMLMIVLDATIVNVALPAIQRDLGFSQSTLAWVVNAYLIAFGGVLLLAGRLGDLVGRRRMFLAGLAIFTAASLACGISDSQETLIIARFVQGVGGAMTSSAILG